MNLKAVFFVGAIVALARPAIAHVSLGGPTFLWGQNHDTDGQIAAGGWGLFLGSQIRFGLAAYSQLSEFDPTDGSGSNFNMIHGGALAFYTLNPSTSAAVEFSVGSLVGTARVAVPSIDTATYVFCLEPTVLALLRFNPWLALGVDGRYRYVAQASVGPHVFDNLSGFSAGLTLVFGSGDGR